MMKPDPALQTAANADKGNHRPRTILVTDAGRGSAIAIIRSLGRRGMRVIAADSSRQCLGFHSRYTGDRLVYPSPETNPQDFVEMLFNTVRQQAVDLVVPLTDAAILPLSQARDQFDGVCRLAIPEPETLELVTNKRKTLELARRLGVPTPKTCLVETTKEALAEAPSLGWPVVLKPMASRKFYEQKMSEGFTVSYAADHRQLAQQMSKYEGRCPVLLQEYYPGEGCGVELLLYEGRPLAAFQHRRLHEIPVNGGASAYRQSSRLDPLLFDYAVRMMAALSYTGLAMVEFKMGRDGPRLMEINGRVWGSLPLAVLSGMDFPGLLADLYFDGLKDTCKDPITTYRVGLRARNFELDMLWILSVIRGKKRYAFLPMPGRVEGLKALLGLFNPANRFDIISLQDPLPGLYEIAKVLRKIGTKMREAD